MYLVAEHLIDASMNCQKKSSLRRRDISYFTRHTLMKHCTLSKKPWIQWTKHRMPKSNRERLIAITMRAAAPPFRWLWSHELSEKDFLSYRVLSGFCWRWETMYHAATTTITTITKTAMAGPKTETTCFSHQIHCSWEWRGGQRRGGVEQQKKQPQKLSGHEKRMMVTEMVSC